MGKFGPTLVRHSSSFGVRSQATSHQPRLKSEMGEQWRKPPSVFGLVMFVVVAVAVAVAADCGCC